MRCQCFCCFCRTKSKKNRLKSNTEIRQLRHGFGTSCYRALRHCFCFPRGVCKMFRNSIFVLVKGICGCCCRLFFFGAGRNQRSRECNVKVDNLNLHVSPNPRPRFTSHHSTTGNLTVSVGNSDDDDHIELSDCEENCFALRTLRPGPSVLQYDVFHRIITNVDDYDAWANARESQLHFLIEVSTCMNIGSDSYEHDTEQPFKKRAARWLMRSWFVSALITIFICWFRLPMICCAKVIGLATQETI